MDNALLVVRKAFLLSATSRRQRRYGLHPLTVSLQTEEVRTPSDTVIPSGWYPRVTFLILTFLSDRVPVNNQTPRAFILMDFGLFLLARLPDLAFSLGVQRATLTGKIDSRNPIQRNLAVEYTALW